MDIKEYCRQFNQKWNKKRTEEPKKKTEPKKKIVRLDDLLGSDDSGSASRPEEPSEPKVDVVDDLTDQGAYIPTQEEIERMCAEFQKSWTPVERRTRSSGFDKTGTFDNVSFKNDLISD